MGLNYEDLEEIGPHLDELHKRAMQKKGQTYEVNLTKIDPVYAAERASGVQDAETPEEDMEAFQSEGVESGTMDAGILTTCTCSTYQRGDGKTDVVCSGSGTVTWTRGGWWSCPYTNINGKLRVENGCTLELNGCVLNVDEDIEVRDNYSALSIDTNYSFGYFYPDITVGEDIKAETNTSISADNADISIGEDLILYSGTDLTITYSDVTFAGNSKITGSYVDSVTIDDSTLHFTDLFSGAAIDLANGTTAISITDSTADSTDYAYWDKFLEYTNSSGGSVTIIRCMPMN